MINLEKAEKDIFLQSMSDVSDKLQFINRNLNDYLTFNNHYSLYIYRKDKEDNLQISARTTFENQKICITLYDGCFNGCYGLFKDKAYYAKGTIVHELAHVIDISHNYKFSDFFLEKLGGEYKQYKGNIRYFPVGYGIYKGTTKNGHVNHYDDFAESFATYIYGPSYDKQGFFVDNERLMTISMLFESE
ncbi:hypothetical protein [Paenibacillus campi]|uniref:hypothetical protein n=1 Tax=Paenibacillus campi TaxID=3106031 RepID=UPI002AFDE949|nr:hypothetical protein [Paenibacillus sp. SGZ-1014]